MGINTAVKNSKNEKSSPLFEGIVFPFGENKKTISTFCKKIFAEESEARNNYIIMIL